MSIDRATKGFLPETGSGVLAPAGATLGLAGGVLAATGFLPEPGRPEEILPLRLDGVRLVRQGRELVGPLTLELAAGNPTVLLGPNGAGKSLTLRLCHGLLEPTSGRVTWRGPDGDQARRLQAMVFQRPVLLRRSALGNVTYALALKGIPRAGRVPLALEALRAAGLEKLAARPARVLSAGEQQRVALARAWALRPRVLFLDEPTASLDPAACRAVEEIIAAIHTAGTKIVMTTHDLGQARRVAGEVVFIHRGKVLEQTPAPEFFDSPRSEAGRSFLKGELLW